ncbi:hypothetical protein [Desulfonatronospira thiodismutans]|uniref:hypothetical protein n=1 Tax=Desulfonatronospira thiodismutans TaxID=488939 RepID=UPI0011853966|nr:hypothetical protein [Desulfonatronospira thiodismutans]
MTDSFEGFEDLFMNDSSENIGVDLVLPLKPFVKVALQLIKRLGGVKQDQQGCQKVMRALNIWLSPAGGGQKCSS